MIERGTHVIVTTADGTELQRVAVSEVVDGEDFPVVWICPVEEWADAESEGREPVAWSWPSEDVRVAEFA